MTKWICNECYPDYCTCEYTICPIETCPLKSEAGFDKLRDGREIPNWEEVPQDA